MDPDAKALGPVVMDFYATSLERGLAARDRADARRFVDVHHDDFVADGLAVARRIVDHFGLPWTDGVRTALEAHSAAHPQGKHGRHEYALADYGLTEPRVLERFAPYIERFGIAVH
jgi:hypothetical protein